MKTCICLSFDGNLKVPAAVMIQSLMDNYSGSNILDVVCIVPKGEIQDISEIAEWVDAPKFDISFRAPIEHIDIDLYSIEHPHWATNIIFDRLFFGSTLHDYDKVIYFDSDMLAIKDIQPILDFKLEGKIAATPDFSQSIVDRENPHVVEYNNGMFIADLNWWRDSGIEKTFKSHLKEEKLDIFPEQKIFNVYTKSVYQPTPLTFNFFMFRSDYHQNPDWDSSMLREHYEQAIILHFAGRVKPWNYKEDVSKVGKLWREKAESIRKPL